ncbi:oxidoreductase [Fulvimarina sp. MAC3]|uniref:oxidoreductase n=1 Tax=Fulvimarina sp. MAC3 TaxID=3148887 RepID=UPI0031FC4461
MKTLTLAAMAAAFGLALVHPTASIARGGPQLPLEIEAGTSEAIVLDGEALAALPTTGFETTTPWTEGPTRFEGVPLSVLIDRFGIQGETIEATALNDYSVTLPATDENGFDPLVAYKVNGEYISVRDKGPFWIVYPFDSDDRLASEAYYSRSIWQLNRLSAR